MKQCPKCEIEKDQTHFYLRKSGKRAGELYEKCKECMKIRGRNYYLINREKQLPLALARRRRARLEKRDLLIKLKNVPCLDCGKIYPHYIMDFDHREGTNKVTNIATMFVKNWSLDKIRSEIVKCDVVCANCHRARTHKRAEVAKVVTAGL